MEKQTERNITQGMTIGTCLAMIISWSINQSIFWCILHGLFSWLYVIYYILIR